MEKLGVWGEKDVASVERRRLGRTVGWLLSAEARSGGGERAKASSWCRFGVFGFDFGSGLLADNFTGGSIPSIGGCGCWVLVMPGMPIGDAGDLTSGDSTCWSEGDVGDANWECWESFWEFCVTLLLLFGLEKST
jgi:hypothetical protein